MIFYSSAAYLGSPFIDEIYEQFPEYWGSSCRHWALSFICNQVWPYKNRGKILDVLCGKSVLPTYLKRKGFDIYGVDIGMGSFQHARSDKIGQFVYNDVRVFREDAESLSFEDGEFICTYLVDVYRWCSFLQKGNVSDHRIFSKEEIDFMDEKYPKVLKEACRVTKERIIIVDRVFLSNDPNPKPTMNWETMIGILKEDGFKFISEIPKGFPACTLVVDSIGSDRWKSRNYEKERITYYMMGIVVER